jgi:UDP-N-acetylmuramyl pentapeptide phosphotransferase/UDP-N-acetylglucosamine-1-phosphate transferase
MPAELVSRLLVLASVALIAFGVSLETSILLRPWLLRHALARPNARSSHNTPTPQGGGIAVLIATLFAAWGALILLSMPTSYEINALVTLTAAALLLGIVGAIDDIHSLPPAARLIVQGVAVAALIAALPHDMRLLPHVPWWTERFLLFVAGLWFVNVVNFMDGIDWMTVAEFIPLTMALSLLGVAGTLDWHSALLASALLGAIGGFAPFNKPVARLFLGDVGSLPAGLLLGWLLLQLAASGHLIAALILPLYYLADATITLGRRIRKREPFWQAHRTHFYQRALDNGFSVTEIITRVFALNLALAALAFISMFAPTVALPALAFAAVLVAWLLRAFARRR